KEHPFLLDMTPATNTFADAALPLGGTFTDPDGKVKITLVSRTAASAQIRFEFPSGGGQSTCLDGTRITGSGGTPPPPPPPPDAGTGTPDAGTGTPDAGTGTPDAGGG